MSTKNIHEMIETRIGTVPAVFLYAFFELVLVVLLFLDGLIFFASHEFACLFGLEIPCMLCTRIDHFLVPRERDFYYMDSLCDNHAKYVSSFAYCGIHSRLATIHQMCNRCVLSFGTEKKSNLEIKRSTLGTLGQDIEFSSKIQLKLATKRNEDDSDVTKKSRKHRCPCCSASPRARAFDNFVANPTAKDGNKSSGISEPRSHISCVDIKITPETETIEEDDFSSPVIPENDSDSNDKIIENLNKLMFNKASDGIQEQPQGTVSQQESLRVPNFNAHEWKNVSLQRVLHYKNSSIEGASENHGDSDAKVPKCLDFYDVYKMINSASNAYGRTNSTRLPMLHRRSSSVGKDEVCIGSFKGSTVSKVDGKNLLQRLKRRVRSERKTLMTLYTELEKERSASAVAADEAMAMIRRLQEEKATVQMQGSQYQRMMEEQAKYDEDALQNMSDLLFKREKEIRFLEAELETYREQFQFKEMEYEVERWQGIQRHEAITAEVYQRLNSGSNSLVSGDSELQASFNNRVREENDEKHEINCN